MKQIIRDYVELARPEDIKKDIWFSILVLSGIVLVSFIAKISIQEVLKHFYNSISNIITAFSILAGFNITSLSILSTSDSKIARNLREEVIKGTDRKKIEQILAYFSWSTIIQLILLVISILGQFMYAYITHFKILFENKLGLGILWISVLIVFVAVLYSIMLTLRNITILYYYLVAESRNK